MLKNALSLSGQTLGDTIWFNGWCGVVWARLLDTLIADLLTKAPSAKVSRLTRLLLVAGLIQQRAANGAAFSSLRACIGIEHRHRVAGEVDE